MTLIVVLLLGGGAVLVFDAVSSDPAHGGQPYNLLALVGSLWRGNVPALEAVEGVKPPDAATAPTPTAGNAGEITAAPIGGVPPATTGGGGGGHVGGLGASAPQPPAGLTTAREWVRRRGA